MKASFSSMTKKERRFVAAFFAVVFAVLIAAMWWTSPMRLYPEVCGVKEPPRWCMD